MGRSEPSIVVEHLGEDEPPVAFGPALDRLNSEFSTEGLPSIRVRIGINTGKMTQCSVGTSRRMEFTVLGDAVNTASRLESFDLPDDGSTARVLVAERTLELAGGDFATRSVGELRPVDRAPGIGSEDHAREAVDPCQPFRGQSDVRVAGRLGVVVGLGLDDHSGRLAVAHHAADEVCGHVQHGAIVGRFVDVQKRLWGSG